LALVPLSALTFFLFHTLCLPIWSAILCIPLLWLLLVYGPSPAATPADRQQGRPGISSSRLTSPQHELSALQVVNHFGLAPATLEGLSQLSGIAMKLRLVKPETPTCRASS
jgi:hypothetical protein